MITQVSILLHDTGTYNFASKNFDWKLRHRHLCLPDDRFHRLNDHAVPHFYCPPADDSKQP